ncbi:GntR family transcriptional regulator [Streptomyces sp. NBC_01803]|uniref:GntR family transcriptional regulator n=1 Tax=Streptomyces sp. NBC_01803 TaxID=2975946 RepID=UPI002DD9F5FD|nr:GntR family transcriptional regulator [Streptomyces sp. NBC_01803]WSA45982.1 GntR family transcriptional regulator [Streptomyces sp. NBC_01803]
MSLADDIEIIGTSTAQQVADGLMRMILEGKLHPGERLRESALASSLGLSRNTVREAVRLLQSGGLVRYHFNRGLVIWDPTDADIVDVYRARLHFEVAAATSVTPETDLEAVRRALEEFKRALVTHDPRTIVEKDLAVHQAVVRLLGSERIDGYYAQLMNELRYFLLVLSFDHREYENTDELKSEHDRIYDALVSRDHERARTVITEITTRNRDAVREVVARRVAGR